jgi:hypothetical protein
MAASPVWKVYSPSGEYVGSCKYSEDAARFIYMDGMTIRYQHKLVVWTEGEEECSASESFDRCAEIMRVRVEQHFAGMDGR